MPRTEQASSQLTSPLAIQPLQQQCFALVPGGEGAMSALGRAGEIAVAIPDAKASPSPVPGVTTAIAPSATSWG
jgi:hypothetical protein